MAYLDGQISQSAMLELIMEDPAKVEVHVATIIAFVSLIQLPEFPATSKKEAPQVLEPRFVRLLELEKALNERIDKHNQWRLRKRVALTLVFATIGGELGRRYALRGFLNSPAIINTIGNAVLNALQGLAGGGSMAAMGYGLSGLFLEPMILNDEGSFLDPEDSPVDFGAPQPSTVSK